LLGKIYVSACAVNAKPLVLMGFAEAQSAPEVAWSLADAGFEVWSFGRRDRRSALGRSKYAKVLEVTPPEIDAQATVDDIFSVANAANRAGAGRTGVMLPLDDATVHLCGQAAMPPGWKLAGPLFSDAKLALDKKVQVEMARAAGFLVPETMVASTTDEALRYAGCFPIIFKPADAISFKDGRLRKGRNWICANRAEFERAVASWQGNGTFLIQPFLYGAGEGIFGFATVHGVEAWSAHRRLRMMNPHGSGSSACVSQPVPEDLKGPAEKLVKDTGWRGLFMIELLRDDSGKRWFVEFNGRPWGSMALSRRQGLEYPAWNVKLAADPQWCPPKSETAASTLVCRNLGREIMHLMFVLRGRNSSAIRNWPSFWRSAAGVLNISLRDSFYNFRRDDLKVFVSDCYYTIRDQVFKPRYRRHAK
jgi:predicted ATP-grasp superfamily ATP-dependent carboligase